MPAADLALTARSREDAEMATDGEKLFGFDMWITLDAAAARTGVSRAMLQKAVRRGQLKGMKELDESDGSPMPKWWVLESDLERFTGRKLLPSTYALQHVTSPAFKSD